MLASVTPAWYTQICFICGAEVVLHCLWKVACTTLRLVPFYCTAVKYGHFDQKMGITSKCCALFEKYKLKHWRSISVLHSAHALFIYVLSKLSTQHKLLIRSSECLGSIDHVAHLSTSHTIDFVFLLLILLVLGHKQSEEIFLFS